jgi:hypothetical protein
MLGLGLDLVRRSLQGLPGAAAAPYFASWPIPDQSLTAGQAGRIDLALHFSYNAGALGYAVSPGLPAGLSLEGGVISGTPAAESAPAEFSVTATALDGPLAGEMRTATMRLEVRPGNAAPQGADAALLFEVAATPAEPGNILAAQPAAFDSAEGWVMQSSWSVNGGVAARSAVAAQENIHRDTAIPAGDLLLRWKIRSSNETLGIEAQLGGGFWQEGTDRRAVGRHGLLIPSAGHTRLRFAAKDGWAGSIDDVYLAEISALRARPADIYGLWGQSNMEGGNAGPPGFGTDRGHALVEYLPGRAEAEYGTDSAALSPALDPLQHRGGLVRGVGPGMAFGLRMLRSLASGRRIVLVACARSGTSLVGPDADWAAGAGPSYVAAIAQMQAALSLCPADSRIAGLLWSQGESDNGQEVGTTYPAAFADMLAAARADLAIPALPVVILGPTPEGDPEGRLAASQAGLDQDSGAATAIPGVRFVPGPAGHAQPGDPIHFTAAGNRLRGVAGAAAMAGLA